MFTRCRWNTFSGVCVSCCVFVCASDGVYVCVQVSAIWPRPPLCQFLLAVIFLCFWSFFWLLVFICRTQTHTNTNIHERARHRNHYRGNCNVQSYWFALFGLICSRISEATNNQCLHKYTRFYAANVQTLCAFVGFHIFVFAAFFFSKTFGIFANFMDDFHRRNISQTPKLRE